MEPKFWRVSLLKIVIVLVFIINLLILDLLVIKNYQSFFNNNQRLYNEYSSTLRNKNEKSSSCTDNCVEKIQQVVASIIPTKIPDNISNTPDQTAQKSGQNGSVVKEFYIPLGSGSNGGGDWSDVTGVSAAIDPGFYGQIKKVTFEASMHIPTGNETAYIRLFNVTDKHPVWFSELSITGGDSKLLVSEPITLESGSKLYQVQLKTTLKFTAILDQARIHIMTY